MSDQPEGAAEQSDDQHHSDGLDLARSVMKSAAGSTGPAVPGKRNGSGGRRGKRWTGRIRPGETQMSSAHPDGRDPQGVGAELGRLIDDRGWALDLQVRGVFARWAEIVGTEIGTHSTPETLVDGVLVVRTESTAWATQLKLLAADVVRRVNEELGDGTVTVVEVQGPRGPSWKHGRLSTRGLRGPRDTYG